MKNKAELTKREWLLLSAYLDGELAGRKARQVEELLQSKSTSREALEILRRTKQVLRHAPAHKVPHNFTLTPEMVHKPLLPSFSRVLSYSSALAGVLLVLVFGLDVYSNSLAANVIDERVNTESQTLLAEIGDAAELAEIQKTPVIIQWGTSSKELSGYGMGGGGDETTGPAYGVGGGGDDAVPEVAIDHDTLFGLDERQETKVGEVPQDEESLLAQPPEAQEFTEELESVPTEKQAEPGVPLTKDEEQTSGLILGIQPVEERGEILAEGPLLPETAISSSTLTIDYPWRLMEITLAAAALLTGLAALVFRKRL